MPICNGLSEDDPTTAWARDVVEGHVVSGHLAIRACERHLRDIRDGERRGLFWRPEKADDALQFFPAMLSVTAGAMVGQPFHLPSYTTFVVGSLFGWCRADGRLRFRNGWIETGKGPLALDTPIATPTGWTTMGDIKVGDTVFSDDGKPTRVVDVSPVYYDRECFRLTFSDGCSIVADADHRWNTAALRSGGRPGPRCGPKKGGYWKRTTAEIGATLRLKPSDSIHPQAKWNHRVDVAPALTLPDIELPIPPYTLGAWLGDGDTDSSRITVHCDDFDIVRNIESEGVATVEQRRHSKNIARVSLCDGNGKKRLGKLVISTALRLGIFTLADIVRETGSNRCRIADFLKSSDLFEVVKPSEGRGSGGGTTPCFWTVRSEERARALREASSPPSIKVRLQGLGLLGDKHIPILYLRSGTSQRMSLLQGLMDTDGTVDENGYCYIYLCNKRLIDGVSELLRTLGFKCQIREREASLNGRVVGPVWCIGFKAYSDTPVFRLRRKVARLKHRPHTRSLSLGRMIVACDYAESVPVRCITVDAPSHMFLAGDGFVPTCNSIKSPLLAAVGLYTLAFRGIERAECYAIAKDRNQANVLFADAVAMAHAPIPGKDGESLVSSGILVPRGTGDMTWMLEQPGTMSKFRALAGDERVNGPRPSLVAADEIHEWKSDGPLRTWRSAGAKMPGDFLLLMATNTPAEDQTVGAEWSERYQQVLRGELDDDAAFAYIARTDPGDDPFNDETCWPKSLPCIGLTFPVENVRIEVKSSRNSIGTMLDTKRLYFGIPVGSSEYWINLDAWEAVQGTVDEDAMKAFPCWLGMDLSRKNDLTALGVVWLDDDGKRYAACRYWKPKEGLSEAATADHASYVEWAAAEPPLLNVTPGKAIEYEFVAAEVQRFCAQHDVQAMAFDPAHIDEFRKACDRIGFNTWIWNPDEPEGDGLKMVVHSQGRAGMHSKKALWMPRSLGQFEDLILTDSIIIDASPVTRWCSGNAAVKPDEQGNRYFVKKRLRGRIDGMVALAMAVGTAISDVVEITTSVYDERGLFVL